MRSTTTNVAGDWVTALGRLLSDKALRESFRKDAWATVRELGLSPADAAYLAALEPEQLEVQARTLVSKRLSEVRRLLPRTFAGLGHAAADLFEEHASGYWPAGQRRHRLDAAAFVRFLRERGVEGIFETEARRIGFATATGWGLRLRVGWVPRREVGSRLAPGLQVLLGHRGRWWEWVLRLAV